MSKTMVIFTDNIVQQIFNIAYATRVWCESQAKQGHFYGRKNLCGWCARATAHLYTALTNAGFECVIHCHSSSHVFLTTQHYTVDVTATQFDEFSTTPVVILDSKQSNQYLFYRSDWQFFSVSELISWQQQRGWPQCELAQHVDVTTLT